MNQVLADLMYIKKKKKKRHWYIFSYKSFHLPIYCFSQMPVLLLLLVYIYIYIYLMSKYIYGFSMSEVYFFIKQALFWEIVSMT